MIFLLFLPILTIIPFVPAKQRLFFTHLCKMLEELQMIEDIKAKGNTYICMLIYNCCYCYSLREKQELFLVECQIFYFLFFYDFGSCLIASDQMMKQLLLKSMRTGLCAGEEKALGENVYITDYFLS